MTALLLPHVGTAGRRHNTRIGRNVGHVISLHEWQSESACMPENTEDDSTRCTFAVYQPSLPGLPWLSVCLGPNGQVLDAQAFVTPEDAHIVTQKAQEIWLNRIRQTFEQTNDASAH